MLSWLAAPNTASRRQSGHPTMLADAPQTPAPVFAYRALRSIVFGETNDSDLDLSDSEKENSQPSRKPKPPGGNRGPPTPKSQTNRAVASRKENAVKVEKKPESAPTTAKSQVVKENAAPMPSTPARRPSRLNPSPSKSILKVSGPGGIGTPRKQGASVSFMGVKRRASTESRTSSCGKGETPVPTKAATAGKKAEKPRSEDTADVVEPKDGATPAMVDKAYVASTEREMKRLVLRGQQAREYAKDLQGKLLDVKQELAKVTRQNELLRREMAGQGKKEGDFGRRPAPKVGETLVHASRKEDVDELFDLSPSVKPKNNPPKGRDKEMKIESISQKAKPKSSRAPAIPLTPAPGFDMFNSVAITDSLPVPSSRSAPRSHRQARTTHHSRTPQQPQRQPLTLLPPSRESAAQARLRAKREARKLARQETK